jgi:penicillin-binding protein 2
MPNLIEEYKKGKVYNTRTFIIIGIQVFLFCALLLRLFYLQIFEFEKYKSKSEENRIQIIPIPPLRGNIFDRNDKQLTINRDNYRVLLYRYRGYDKEVIDRLASILNISKASKNKIEERLKKNKHRPVVSLIDNLTWDQLAKVQFNYYRLDGIAIESGYIRKYPFYEQFAHVLGYVSMPAENEIPKGLKERELFLHPDYRIGKTGIEKFYEDNITGIPGFRNVEVNAYRIPLREIAIKKAQEGKNIKLTIDSELQNYVTERMKGLVGAVVVMDVNTGEILTMVSAPTFNPNEFVEGVSQEYWDELINNQDKPLNNKAISAMYPPGSTFKLIVALAGLEKGWNGKQEINCSGRTWLNERIFHCWKERGHGRTNLIKAIMESCNIYFAQLSLFTTIDNISEMARNFGIGEKFNISLPDVKSGLMPDRRWKATRLNDIWVRGDTVNTGIGQGFTLVTPLQLAVMTARIANGGYPINPFLIYDSVQREKNAKLFEIEPMVKKENMDLVKQGMYMVVNERNGTAYWGRIKEKDFKMAGKTGTAQIISKERMNVMEESEKEIKRYLKNHALFVAFAPFENPKYAISVVIEHGERGSASAVPVAKDIFEFLRKEEVKNFGI